MISVIAGKKIKQVESLHIDSGYKKVIVDLGCGDGKQPYRLAYEHPEYFVIGIDANFKGLELISRKVAKKPHKGGLPNIIFLHGVAEHLPKEIEGIADEVHINFPWGSLLEGVVTADETILENIVRIVKNNALLFITTTYDDKYEEQYRQEKSLPELSKTLFLEDLFDAYLQKGIKINNVLTLTDRQKNEITSPWGKRILDARDREVYRIEGKLVK